MPHTIQRSPFIVPVPDNKHIEEHFGLASIAAGDFSLARMVAPPGWSEPFQTPEFDEITLVISGKKQIETDGQVIVLHPNESILIQKGTQVRYSNPFELECMYVSLCIPAFSPARVHRQAE